MDCTLCEDPGTPLWCLQPMEKCIQTRKHKYTFTILNYSRQCNFLKKRLLFYRLENSAKTMDIPMSRSAVKKCSRVIHQFWEQFVVNIDIAGFVFNKSSPNAKRKDARFPFSQQTAGSWKNEIRSIQSPARLRNSHWNQTLTLSHTRSVCLQ